MTFLWVLAPLVLVAALQLAAHTAGRAVAAGLGRVAGDPAEAEPSLLHVQLLGFSALANLAVVLATVGLLRPGLLLLSTLALAAPGAVRAARWPGWGRRPGLEAIPVGLGVALVAFLPAALYPTYYHDDVAYHLTLPSQYLAAGSWVPRPDLLFANMPHLVEMLGTWALAGGEVVAMKVLVLTFSFWTLFGLVEWARPRAGWGAATLLAMAYLAGRNVQWHFGPAHIEPVIGAFLLGAVVALSEWWETGRAGSLRLVALHLGFVAASKYTVWSFVVWVALATAILVARREGWRRGLRRFVIVGLTCAGFVLPWLVKNAVVTGNPLYPALFRWLGGLEMSAVQQLHQVRAVAARAGGWDPSWLDRLISPWHLAVGDNYYNCPSFSVVLMAAFLVAVAWPRNWRGPAGFLTPLALAGLATWVVGITNGRYLLPWVPILALASLPVWRDLARRPARAVLAGLVCLGVAGLQVRYQQPPLRTHLEVFTTPRAELEATNPTRELCRRLDALGPPDGVVLAMWENRLLFLDRPARVDGVYESPRALARLREADDPARFAAGLRDHGVTHVVIHARQMELFLDRLYPWPLLHPELYPVAQSERDGELMRAFVADHLELLFQLGPHGVFRLATGPPVSPERPGPS